MTKRPHVVLEALQVKKDPAGTGRGIMDLCWALAEKDRNLDFTVLTTAGEIFRDLENRPGWRVRECPQARGGAIQKAMFIQFRLPGLVRRIAGDILHSMQFLVPLRCPCIQVATVHDLAWHLYPETIEEPRRSYYRWLVPRSLAKVDAIVANSRSTAADARRFFPQASRKIHVTPHGTPRWVLDRVCREDPHQEAGGRPFFLFVGTLEPRKNLSRLMDAYEAFLASDAARDVPDDEVPDLVFVGGRGWKNSSQRHRMADLQGRGRLRVMNYVPLDELWDLYCNALALVFPSLHEGFGLPVLEAMTAGLPVLTSNRSGTAEVAGGKALLVDPENPGDIASGLARLAFDADLRQRLAKAGRGQCRKWSWSRTADLTVSVYLQLLKERPGKKGLLR
jgi:glycosyltransferase involved in cell wall biosynthesis